MSDAGLSMGVEEEFLLVDPVTGATVARAEPVLARARAAPPPAPDTGLQAELLRTQVEAATGVCTRLAEVRRQLRESRALLADAARAEDARLVSTGTAVTAAAAPAFAFSPGERFQRIAEMGGGVFADYEVCGCHVHVGVPDRETALAVVNHLRPWLPTLVALAVNSPIDRGRDRGFASCRVTEKMGRFPCSGVPPWFESVAAYERELARLVDCGAMADTAMTFWLARPSPGCRPWSCAGRTPWPPSRTPRCRRVCRGRWCARRWPTWRRGGRRRACRRRCARRRCGRPPGTA
ncbi:carboxylate-amine ligase [Actinomadura keratinilytica]|uniref:carboxylate-amine ligase n=1 Tax=Actinomadura keratinilytica TaxID=547461 RepID=UPI00360745D1